MVTKVSKNLFFKPLKPLIFAICLVSMTSCSDREIKKALCAFLGAAVGVCVSIVWPPEPILDRILGILGAGGAGWVTKEICEGLLVLGKDERNGNVTVTPMPIDGRQPRGLLITTHCDEYGENCAVVSLDFSFVEEAEEEAVEEAEEEADVELENNKITDRDSAARFDGGIPAPATCQQLDSCNSNECCAKYRKACNSKEFKRLHQHDDELGDYFCKKALPKGCNL